MPDLLFHDLRRSAARDMDITGISRRVIKSITGYKTESMFLRYRIVSECDLRAAATSMEQFMSESNPAVTAKVTAKVTDPKGVQ